MKISATIILLLFAFLSIGQEVRVSEELSVRNDDDYRIIGKLNDEILLFKDKGDILKIFSYNQEMEMSWEKKINLESRRARVLEVIPQKDHFTMVYRYFKRGKIYVRAMEFSPEADTMRSSTLISFVPRATNALDLVVSNDKSKIFLYDSDINSKIYATCFDLKTMENLWQIQVKPIEFDFQRDFVQALVDNKGNGFLILERDNKKAKRNTSRFEVLGYDIDLQQQRRYNIGMKGKLWLDVEFQVDNLNNRLVGAGLFSNKKYGETNGHFYLRINPQNPEDYFIHFSDFDEKFVTSILGKEIKKEVGFGEVSVQELVLRRDGGLLMVAERNKKYTRRATSYNSFYNPDNAIGYQVDYHYNDILLISIHPNGDTHWKELLRKRQFSQDDRARYSSYFLLKTRNSLRFLYNDEIKQDTNVNEYIVLGDGQSKRKNILNTDDDDIYLLFREGMQLSSNELIVPSERRGDLRLVKFIY
ncbi:MAG: hypothetical protein AAF502_04075 [Bacteroidota bacterium]